jgi:CheY-like chemotaxis protein
VRAVARRILERGGYRVLEASNGGEALEFSGAFPDEIHLVITDVVMPGLTGPELVHRLHHARPDLRAILTSGYPGEAIASRGARTGDLVLLAKPFSAESLNRVVRSELDRESRA